MKGSDDRNIDSQTGISWISSPAYGKVALDFLIRGTPHPCPYRASLEACEQVFMAESFPAELYHDFMDVGFRRSGIYFYRPDCVQCSGCRPIRTVSGEI